MICALDFWVKVRCHNELRKSGGQEVARHFTSTERSRERSGFPAIIQRYLRQDGLTIFTFVTFKCPCSLLLLAAPVSCATSFAPSFMLCIIAWETTPVRVTV